MALATDHRSEAQNHVSEPVPSFWVTPHYLHEPPRGEFPIGAWAVLRRQTVQDNTDGSPRIP
jgi:hypothetical protein